MKQPPKQNQKYSDHVSFFYKYLHHRRGSWALVQVLCPVQNQDTHVLTQLPGDNGEGAASCKKKKKKIKQTKLLQEHNCCMDYAPQKGK